MWKDFEDSKGKVKSYGIQLDNLANGFKDMKGCLKKLKDLHLLPPSYCL